MDEYVIQMQGITKRFPGVLANDEINLEVFNNEVHALLGENGAGKSTLMSILFGSYESDSGVIFVRGKSVTIKNQNDATDFGIGMVHQHFKLVPNYTVTENIILGLEPVNRFGIVNLAEAERRVNELSQTYGLQVNAKDKIEDISVGMQQRVEILKTLYRETNILILDEPTAVLTPQEIDELMEIIKRLKEEGKTIILITHKLKEIKTVADRCTILRRGKNIATVTVSDTTEQQLAEMMVGRTIQFNIEKSPCKSGKAVLELKNVCVKNSRGVIAIRDLTLTVKSGEILGIAGVDGNGQSELIYAITGLVACQSGSILLNGKEIVTESIKNRIRLGVGHIPEDRHRHGLILNFSIAENAIIKNYEKKPYSSYIGILNFKAINKNASVLIKQYDIRAGEGSSMKTKNMSGGNQQKLIIAREISLSPEILVIAQPTRGLDVGAIESIRKRILEERDKGRAVLLISFELDEIMNLCDRIAIMSKGEIAGIFNQDEVDEKHIGYLMAGSKKNQPMFEGAE